MLYGLSLELSLWNEDILKESLEESTKTLAFKQTDSEVFIY